MGRTNDDINVFGSGSSAFSDIQFGKFTTYARIQIHGCNGGAVTSSLEDNIAATLSRLLYNANKRRAFVIAHTTYANPSIRGSSTTNSQQDYRHGRRAIYYNGTILFQITQTGYIADGNINRRIP